MTATCDSKAITGKEHLEGQGSTMEMDFTQALTNPKTMAATAKVVFTQNGQSKTATYTSACTRP